MSAPSLSPRFDSLPKAIQEEITAAKEEIRKATPERVVEIATAIFSKICSDLSTGIQNPKTKEPHGIRLGETAIKQLTRKQLGTIKQASSGQLLTPETIGIIMKNVHEKVFSVPLPKSAQNKLKLKESGSDKLQDQKGLQKIPQVLQEKAALTPLQKEPFVAIPAQLQPARIGPSAVSVKAEPPKETWDNVSQSIDELLTKINKTNDLKELTEIGNKFNDLNARISTFTFPEALILKMEKVVLAHTRAIKEATATAAAKDKVQPSVEKSFVSPFLGAAKTLDEKIRNDFDQVRVSLDSYLTTKDSQKPLDLQMTLKTAETILEQCKQLIFKLNTIKTNDKNKTQSQTDEVHQLTLFYRKHSDQVDVFKQDLDLRGRLDVIAGQIKDNPEKLSEIPQQLSKIGEEIQTVQNDELATSLSEKYFKISTLLEEQQGKVSVKLPSVQQQQKAPSPLVQPRLAAIPQIIQPPMLAQQPLPSAGKKPMDEIAKEVARTNDWFAAVLAQVQKKPDLKKLSIIAQESEDYAKFIKSLVASGNTAIAQKLIETYQTVFKPFDAALKEAMASPQAVPQPQAPVQLQQVQAVSVAQPQAAPPTLPQVAQRLEDFHNLFTECAAELENAKGEVLKFDRKLALAKKLANMEQELETCKHSLASLNQKDRENKGKEIVELNTLCPRYGGKREYYLKKLFPELNLNPTMPPIIQEKSMPDEFSKGVSQWLDKVKKNLENLLGQQNLKNQKDLLPLKDKFLKFSEDMQILDQLPLTVKQEGAYNLLINRVNLVLSTIREEEASLKGQPAALAQPQAPVQVKLPAAVSVKGPSVALLPPMPAQPVTIAGVQETLTNMAKYIDTYRNQPVALEQIDFHFYNIQKAITTLTLSHQPLKEINELSALKLAIYGLYIKTVEIENAMAPLPVMAAPSQVMPAPQGVVSPQQLVESASQSVGIIYDQIWQNTRAHDAAGACEKAALEYLANVQAKINDPGYTEIATAYKNIATDAGNIKESKLLELKNITTEQLNKIQEQINQAWAACSTLKGNERAKQKQAVRDLQKEFTNIILTTYCPALGPVKRAAESFYTSVPADTYIHEQLEESLPTILPAQDLDQKLRGLANEKNGIRLLGTKLDFIPILGQGNCLYCSFYTTVITYLSKNPNIREKFFAEFSDKCQQLGIQEQGAAWLQAVKTVLTELASTKKTLNAVLSAHISELVQTTRQLSVESQRKLPLPDGLQESAELLSEFNKGLKDKEKMEWGDTNDLNALAFVTNISAKSYNIATLAHHSKGGQGLPPPDTYLENHGVKESPLFSIHVINSENHYFGAIEK